EGRECRMEIAEGEDRGLLAVRGERVDHPREPGEGDGVTYDLTRPLMIGVPRPADPGIAPGDDRVGLDLRDQLRHRHHGVARDLHRRVGEIEEPVLAPQDPGRRRAMFLAYSL